MKLTLPEAESAEIGEKKSYTLFVTSEGDFFLNNEEVTEDSLMSALEAIVPELEGETLTVKADAETSHGRVVKVMDFARIVGVKRLIVATAEKR